MAALSVAVVTPSGAGTHDVVLAPAYAGRIVIDRLLVQGTTAGDGQLVEVYGGAERLAVLMARSDAPVTVAGAVQCDDGQDRHVKVAPGQGLSVRLSASTAVLVTCLYHFEGR